MDQSEDGDETTVSRIWVRAGIRVNTGKDLDEDEYEHQSEDEGDHDQQLRCRTGRGRGQYLLVYVVVGLFHSAQVILHISVCTLLEKAPRLQSAPTQPRSSCMGLRICRRVGMGCQQEA